MGKKRGELYIACLMKYQYIEYKAPIINLINQIFETFQSEWKFQFNWVYSIYRLQNHNS